jgi:hypothetical protein
MHHQLELIPLALAVDSLILVTLDTQLQVPLALAHTLSLIHPQAHEPLALAVLVVLDPFLEGVRGTYHQPKVIPSLAVDSLILVTLDTQLQVPLALAHTLSLIHPQAHEPLALARTVQLYHHRSEVQPLGAVK